MPTKLRQKRQKRQLPKTPPSSAMLQRFQTSKLSQILSFKTNVALLMTLKSLRTGDLVLTLALDKITRDLRLFRERRCRLYSRRSFTSIQMKGVQRIEIHKFHCQCEVMLLYELGREQDHSYIRVNALDPTYSRYKQTLWYALHPQKNPKSQYPYCDWRGC